MVHPGDPDVAGQRGERNRNWLDDEDTQLQPSGDNRSVEEDDAGRGNTPSGK